MFGESLSRSLKVGGIMQSMFNGIRPPDDAFRSAAARRWGRRFGIAIVTLIVAAFVGHGVWSLTESRKLEAQIAAIQAAGEPILPADFGPADTDAPDNAVTQLVAAAGLLQTKDATWKTFDQFDLGLPLRPEEIASIDAVVTRSTPALDRLKLAEKQPRRVWPIKTDDSTNIIESMLPDLNGIRAMANLSMAAALLEHQRGDDRAAMEHLNRIIFIAEVVDRNPTLVGHLVAVGCRAMAAQRLAEIAPDLRIGAQPTDVSPEDVHRMISRLLDDKPLRDGYIWGMQGERMGELAMVRQILSGLPSSSAPSSSGGQPRGWSPITRYGARPLIYHNARIILDQVSKVIPLANEPNWPAAKTKVPGEIQGPFALTFLARILSPSFGRAAETHFRVICEQHLAAAALACDGTRWTTTGSFRPSWKNWFPSIYRRFRSMCSLPILDLSDICRAKIIRSSTASAKTASTTAAVKRHPIQNTPSCGTNGI